jgi:biopolymer transport protein ExbB
MLSNLFHSFTPAFDAWVMMWVMLGIAVAGLAIIIERVIFLWARSNVNAKLFMGEIHKLVSAGDLKKAIALCKGAGEKALPRVVLAALQEADKKEFVDYRAVQNAVDEATLEVMPQLNKRIGYLAQFGNLATLCGLTGTVYGLIKSFEAAGATGGGAEALAAGISVAMFTTLFGLIVALPNILFYTILSTKANEIVDDIDEWSVKLIHLLTGGK